MREVWSGLRGWGHHFHAFDGVLPGCMTGGDHTGHKGLRLNPCQGAYFWKGIESEEEGCMWLWLLSLAYFASMKVFTCQFLVSSWSACVRISAYFQILCTFLKKMLYTWEIFVENTKHMSQNWWYTFLGWKGQISALQVGTNKTIKPFRIRKGLLEPPLFWYGCCRHNALIRLHFMHWLFK